MIKYNHYLNVLTCCVFVLFIHVQYVQVRAHGDNHFHGKLEKAVVKAPKHNNYSQTAKETKMTERLGGFL